METKGHIRKAALEQREALTQKERGDKSNVIMQKVMELPIYMEAKHIIVYAAYKSEVDTKTLIDESLKAGKKVYCPKIEGEEMEFYRITGMDSLSNGYKGIKEPQTDEKLLLTGETISKGDNIMVVPGSAFDKERNRIGYGKGYYDKYIEKHMGLHTVAVCFACQLQESIPVNEHDKKPDILLTEYNIYT